MVLLAKISLFLCCPESSFHVKMQFCVQLRTNFSLLPWIIAECSSFSLFSTWPGRACSHWCCIFHRYMSRHETNQSPPINLQSCFSSFFAPFHLFFIHLCVPNVPPTRLSQHFVYSDTFFLSLPNSVSPRQLQTRGGARRSEHLPALPGRAAHLPAWQHCPQRLRLQAGLPASRHDLPEWVEPMWFLVYPVGSEPTETETIAFDSRRKRSFGPLLMKAFTFVPIIWSLHVAPSQYLLCKDWPQLCFLLLLSGGSWPVWNQL